MSLRTPAATADRTHAPRHDTLQLGALSGIVGFHLARASVPTYAAFERHIGKPYRLRKVEFSLLMLLLTNQPVVAKQLAQSLALTAPQLSQLLDALETRALVRRERHPSDGRSQHLLLTDKGRKLARAAADAAVPMEQELLTRLSRAERAMLLELLGKLYEL